MDASFCLRSAAVGACAGAAAAFLCWRYAARHSAAEVDGIPPRGKPRPDAPGVDTAGVLEKGQVAVITGAGSGIGRETARRCAAAGMKVVLADIDANDLADAERECQGLAVAVSDVLAVRTDVSKLDQVFKLKEKAYEQFKEVNFLMNNAATQSNGRAGPYEHVDRWEKILSVNLWGVYNGCHAFVPAMIAQGTKAVVVNTGSKQGITMPPGDTAYNVSKAGVKVLTEALQHKLRNVKAADGSGGPCKVSAFLLVPGWTITMICTKGNKWVDGDRFDPDKAEDERSYRGAHDPTVAQEKLQARGAWPASKVVDEMWQAVRAGRPFYVICEDHETTRAQDNGRMQWAADDLIFRRVPLSRWSDEYKDEYKAVSKGFI